MTNEERKEERRAHYAALIAEGTMKRCPRCGERKGIGEFSFNVGSMGKFPVSSQCKPCTAEYAREHKRAQRAKATPSRDIIIAIAIKAFNYVDEYEQLRAELRTAEAMVREAKAAIAKFEDEVMADAMKLMK